MKRVLNRLSKGQRILVSLVEIHEQNNLLVEYKGDLFRVRNTSGKRFEIGDRISLVVSQMSPLEFSLVGEQRLLSRMI